MHSLGSPIPFASVYIKGTQTGVSTDADGHYSISVPVGETLVFSFIGFKTVETQVDSRTRLNIVLEPDSEYLDATPGRKVSYNGEDLWMQSDDWYDAAYKNSLRQEYTISVNGNTDKVNYYMSVGYLNEDGIVDYSSYERVSARLKADYQARKWLKVGANIGFTSSKQNLNYGAGTSLSSANLFNFVSSMAPIYPIYVSTIDENGNIAIRTDSYGNPAYDYGIAASNYGVTRPFLAQGNPLGSNRYNDYTSGGNQLNGNFTAEVKFTDWLKADISSTVIWGNTNVSDYGNMLYGPSAASNGYITKSDSQNVRTNNVQTLTYFDTFGKHNVNVMAGTSTDFSAIPFFQYLHFGQLSEKPAWNA